MGNARRQGRVGMSAEDRVGQMLRLACAAAGHHRNRHCLADRRRHFQIIAILGAVVSYAGEHDLARTQFFHLLGHATASSPVGTRPPLICTSHQAAAVGCTRLGDPILTTMHSLPETVWPPRAQIRILTGGRVDRDFVATGIQQADSYSCEATSHGQRHEHLFRGAAMIAQMHVTPFMAGADVKEDQFVGTLDLRGDHNRIAGVTEVHEIGPFHDATTIDVETGNHTLGQHEEIAKKQGANTNFHS